MATTARRKRKLTLQQRKRLAWTVLVIAVIGSLSTLGGAALEAVGMSAEAVETLDLWVFRITALLSVAQTLRIFLNF